MYLCDMKKQKEYILCAAIHFQDGKEYVHMPDNIKTGYVICGRKHHNCFAILGQLLQPEKEYKTLDEIQGFVTNTNRFVTREEAASNAICAGQIEQHTVTLYSEDLY